MSRVAPLKALRRLEDLSEERKKEYGLVDPAGTLLVDVAGKQHQLAIGGRVYGGEDRYALDAASGVAYVLEADVVRPLEFPESNLRLKKLHDFEQDGVEIRKGQTVMAILATANRDRRVYDDPDAFDIERTGVGHLDLGFGFKFCLGASLVRTEANVLFTTLATRYPNLELAVDAEALDWSASNPIMRSVTELPVRLAGGGI